MPAVESKPADDGILSSLRASSFLRRPSSLPHWAFIVTISRSDHAQVGSNNRSAVQGLRRCRPDCLNRSEPPHRRRSLSTRVRRRTPTVGILFRNVILRASLTQLAITVQTEQQYARSLVGRFRTTRRRMVLLSAEGRLLA